MIPDLILNILGMYRFNPQQFQNIKSPDELAQQLLNSGKVNQQQVNRAKQLWGQPNVRQMVNNQFKLR